MKTNLLTNKKLWFDNIFFFISFLWYLPYWDYNNDDDYVSKRITDSGMIDKFPLKAGCVNGSILNGNKKPVLFCFVLNKPLGYKIFCSPETVHFKKINETVQDNVTFYLEDDNNKEVNFNGETLSFTLQLLKIWTTKRVSKNLKLVNVAWVDVTDLLQKTFLVIWLLKAVMY